MTKYIKIANREIIKDEREIFIEFIFEYMNTHKYCSRKFLSGLYINKIYPNKPNNHKELQKKAKRKLGKIFIIFSKHGLVSNFNTSAIRVHDKFKEMSLEDVFDLIAKNT